MDETLRGSRLQAVLVGGTFAGALSALPLIELGNLCCCLWLVGGGVISSRLAQKAQPHPLGLADGAGVGFLAGVAGAFVYVLVAIPIELLTAPFRDGFSEMVDFSDVPPELVELMEQISSGPGAIVVGFFITLATGMVFSTLGGLLGAAIFGRSAESPPGPPMVPPLPPGAPPPSPPMIPPPPGV